MKATSMTHGAMLLDGSRGTLGSVPEGAGGALHGYTCQIRKGGNLKGTAKSTGGSDKGPAGISGRQVRLPGERS